jgi:spore germination protein GerM
MRRHRAWPRVAGVLALVTTTLLTAGCSVPAGDTPRPVDSDIAALLEPEIVPTPTQTAGERLLTVTWVRGDTLVRVGRLGVADTRQDRLDVALAELLDGPLPLGQQKGLTTLLPPDVQVTGEIKRSRAVIALTVGTGLEPGGLPLAVGQVAVTALSVARVRTVVFTVDGVPTEVPLPDDDSGRDTARVVRLSDYRSVLVR